MLKINAWEHRESRGGAVMLAGSEFQKMFFRLKSIKNSEHWTALEILEDVVTIKKNGEILDLVQVKFSDKEYYNDSDIESAIGKTLKLIENVCEKPSITLVTSVPLFKNDSGKIPITSEDVKNHLFEKYKINVTILHYDTDSMNKEYDLNISKIAKKITNRDKSHERLIIKQIISEITSEICCNLKTSLKNTDIIISDHNITATAPENIKMCHLRIKERANAVVVESILETKQNLEAVELFKLKKIEITLLNNDVKLIKSLLMRCTDNEEVVKIIIEAILEVKNDN